jgi:hypothetical protein
MIALLVGLESSTENVSFDSSSVSCFTFTITGAVAFV